MHSRIRLARRLLRLLEREALDWLAPVSEVRVRAASAVRRESR